MKRLLLAASLLGLPLVALAQSSAVPDRISYQGRVTDTAGTPIANGTSTSRSAIFRIYDAASGGNRIWSEAQTITIASGEFSLLLGAGSAVANETNSLSLNAIFTSQDRYIGVTIADAGGALTSEISPRQQLVTTAYAFRAKVAESVASMAVSTAMIANGAVTTTQLTDSAVNTAKLAADAVTSAKIVDGTIATADLAANAVTTAKLATDIGVWTASGSHVYRPNGNAGVGLAAPQSPLHVHGSGEVRMQITDVTSGIAATDGFMLSLGATEAAAWVYENRALKFGTNNSERMRIAANGNIGIGLTTPNAPIAFGTADQNTKIALYDDNSGSLMGLGIGPNQFRFHVANSGNKFSFLDAPAGSEVMTIQGAGRVGINNSNPAGTLTVNAGTDSRISLQNTASGTTLSDGLAVGFHGSAGFFWMYENLPLEFATNNTERMRIDGAGRMGINSAPISGSRLTLKISADDSFHLLLKNLAGTADQFAFGTDGQAYKSGGGSWGSGSDRRLKHNIEPLAGSLEKLLRLRSVTFDYLDMERWGAGRFTGFIAQEVEPLFPDWVSENPDGMKMLAPKGFESLAVQALRELRAEKDEQNAALAARVKELEAQNASLYSQNSAATARLDALEKRVSALANLAATAGNNN